MPRAMYICPVCHKNVLASKAIHIKTRYYHKACLDKKIKKEFINAMKYILIKL